MGKLPIGKLNLGTWIEMYECLVFGSGKTALNFRDWVCLDLGALRQL